MPFGIVLEVEVGLQLHIVGGRRWHLLAYSLALASRAAGFGVRIAAAVPVQWRHHGKGFHSGGGGILVVTQ